MLLSASSATCHLVALCVMPGWRQRLSPFYAASVVRGRWRSLWASPLAAASRVRARHRVPGEYRWRKQSASDRAVLLAGLPSILRAFVHPLGPNPDVEFDASLIGGEKS